MTSILEILSKNHNIWISYVISFGCKKDDAEDFVQEMYIKIYNLTQRKKDVDLMFNEKEINNIFIFVTLKNMYIDSIRKQKKKQHIDIDLITDLKQIESQDLAELILLSNQNEQQEKSVINWEQNLKKQIKKIQGYQQEKICLQYVLWIYNTILINKVSITELSNETKISYWSIRNTVVIIKKQIKQIKSDL